jgi:hypothetical protein
MNHVYHHSGHLGDMIYAMPAMRSMASIDGPIDLEISPIVRSQKLPPINPAGVEAIKPLLLAAPFIRSVTFVERMTAGARNLDVPRYARALPGEKSIAAAHLRKLVNYNVEWLSEPWLSVAPLTLASVIINRSPRWHEPGAEGIWNRILDAAGGRAGFIGLQEDLVAFEQATGRSIRYVPTPNLLEAAKIIAGAEFFVGNQSACLAIAQGLGHPRIAFERSRQFDNCDIPQILTVKFDERDRLQNFLLEIAH